MRTAFGQSFPSSTYFWSSACHDASTSIQASYDWDCIYFTASLPSTPTRLWLWLKWISAHWPHTHFGVLLPLLLHRYSMSNHVLLPTPIVLFFSLWTLLIVCFPFYETFFHFSAQSLLCSPPEHFGNDSRHQSRGYRFFGRYGTVSKARERNVSQV